MTGALPWFKAYPQRWLNATRELTLEERGAYNDLLQLLYLRDRRIPDNARFIASFLGITPRKWNAIRLVLLDHDRLVIAGDYLTDEMFERERAATIREREQQRAARVKGGKARAEQAQRDRQGRFDGFEDENGGNPPPPTSCQLDNSENAVHEEKTQQNQRSASSLELDDLDDSFLTQDHAKNDFRGVFDEFSTNFRGRSEHENGSFPPPSSSSARARERVSDSRLSNNSMSSVGDSLSKVGGSGRKERSRTKSQTARRIPKDWKPEEPTGDVAEFLASWPPGMLDREKAKFIDHANAGGRTLKDWDAGFRNWLRKADDDRQKQLNRERGQGWSAVAHRVAGQSR